MTHKNPLPLPIQHAGRTALGGGRTVLRSADTALQVARTIALAVDPTGGQGRARRNALASTTSDAVRAHDRHAADLAVRAAQQASTDAARARRLRAL